MKGCLKPAVTLVGICLILGALATVLLASQADTYLKRAVERSISKAAGSTAHIETFQIQPLRQSVVIGGLTLDNPAGWRAEPAVKIESVRLHFDARSLLSETPRIKELLIRGAQVNVRYDFGQGSNINRLTQSAAVARPAGPLSGVSRPFKVEACRCEEVHVSLGAGVLPGKLLNVNLAPFTLKDLGEKPVSVAETTSIFLRTVMMETLTFKGLLSPVADKIREELRGAGGS